MIYSKEGLAKGSHTIIIVSKESTSFQDLQAQRNNNSIRVVEIPLDGFMVLDRNIEGNVLLIVNNKWNYTKLGLGNYMKEPILIESEYRDNITIRLTDVNKDHAGKDQ